MREYIPTRLTRWIFIGDINISPEKVIQNSKKIPQKHSVANCNILWAIIYKYQLTVTKGTLLILNYERNFL